MTDNITLRRAAEQARSALSGWANHGLWAWPESALQTCKQNTEEALAALDAALEAQEDEALLNEPVAMRYDGDGYGYLYIDSGSGSDWQRRHKDAEPLYLAPPKPDAKREPATEKQVAEVFKLSGAVYWGHYRNGWRDAERFHGIRKEDGK